MKNPTSIIISVAMVIAYADVLAHGQEGTQTFEKNQPALKLNISTHSSPAAEYRVEPNMELSVDGQTIRLNITEPDGKPIDAEFADAKTFVTTGGRISTVYLWPSRGNTLTGKGEFTPAPGMRVEVMLHLPDRETVRKEFYPLQ